MQVTLEHSNRACQEARHHALLEVSPWPSLTWASHSIVFVDKKKGLAKGVLTQKVGPWTLEEDNGISTKNVRSSGLWEVPVFKTFGSHCSVDKKKRCRQTNILTRLTKYYSTCKQGGGIKTQEVDD